MIKDSGSRTEFSTGAVRDIQEGKGRCDLLPLDVIAKYLDSDRVLMHIECFRTSGDISQLYGALDSFCRGACWDDWTMVLEVSKHFEEGAQKYGEWNWQKGIPVKRYIDSAIRHYLKWCKGDVDEPHDRSFAWNIACCIWTCIHKPELNDYSSLGIRAENVCAENIYVGGVEYGNENQ